MGCGKKSSTMGLVSCKDPSKKSHVWLETAEATTRAYELRRRVLLIPLAQGQDLFILLQDTAIDLNLPLLEISSFVVVESYLNPQFMNVLESIASY